MPLFLCACSEDMLPTVAAPLVVIRMVDVDTGASVRWMKLVLMNPATNLPASDPLISGDDGLIELRGLPPGRYELLVFSGPNRELLTQPEAVDWPATAEVTILLGQRSPPGGVPRISGAVVAADSGAPLARAFLSTTPYPAGYQGLTDASDDVTGPDGAFLVSDIVFTVDPISGNLRQVEPLLVSCPGYRPRAWRYQAPNGSDNLDISGQVIALERIAPADSARICGRALLDGKPAAGVAVGLGLVVEAANAKAGPGSVGWLAVSGPDGRFCCDRLPAGTYYLHPGFLPGDGAVFLDQPANRPWAVTAGGSVETGDYLLLHEIQALEPGPGAPLGTERRLVWSPAPGAATYSLNLGADEIVRTTETTYALPDTLDLAPGLHRWWVLGLDSRDRIIGLNEVDGWFRVE